MQVFFYSRCGNGNFTLTLYAIGQSGWVMEKRPRTRRIEYRLFLWAEDERGNATIWQGVVETASGQHFHFRTLTELDQILYELAGWMDPPTTRTLELP